jgi:hypothetical protein
MQNNCTVEQDRNERNFFLNFFWAGPVDPTSQIPLPISLECKCSCHGDNLSFLKPQALRYWCSQTFPDAQLRPIDLHNFSGQIPESSQC